MKTPDMMTGEPATLLDARPRSLAPAPKLPTADGPIRTALIVALRVGLAGPLSRRCSAIAVCPVAFDRHARMVGIGATLSWIEAPGHKVDPESALPCQTDDHMAGQGIDDAAVLDLLNAAEICIAHGASRTADWIERRFPTAKGKIWCCSKREIAIDAFLSDDGGAGDASADVDALVMALANTLPSGHMMFAELILTAQRPTVLVGAESNSSKVAQLLARRGYRQGAGTEFWLLEVAEVDLEAELAWLAEHAGCNRPVTRTITWSQRHRI